MVVGACRQGTCRGRPSRQVQGGHKPSPGFTQAFPSVYPAGEGGGAAGPGGGQGRRGLSVGLLTGSPYWPELRRRAGWRMLRCSLEGNGKAAAVNALLRRRFPLGAVSAGCAFFFAGGGWASGQSVMLMPTELSGFS